MRRALALTDEAARHPFLASLPPHVRKIVSEDVVQAAWRLTRDDMRGFVSAYLATFLAVLVFIA